MTLRLPNSPPGYDRRWADNLIQSIEQWAVQQSAPGGRGYTVTATGTSRALTASTASTGQIAEFVVTLTNDLIAKGVIAK